MPRTLDIAYGIMGGLDWTGAGSNYVVRSISGALYCIYIEGAADVVYKKSIDNGLTWSNTVVLFTGTACRLSVWYDRWSNISAGLIHCAYDESAGTDELYYRTIDTENSDALSTQTSAISFTSTVAQNGHISITRARGGNVYIKCVTDAGAEGGFFRLLNANVPNGAWDAARTIDEAVATNDNMILAPGFGADNQDIMGIFYDISASELSRKIYDDSANSWTETSIATSIVLPNATTGYPHFAVATDLANSRLIVVCWSAVDTLNADLRCWTVTESAITEVTNVVQNSTDDQGYATIGIDTDTGHWYVAYGGKTDGSETYNTSLNIYYKISTDAGTTWGAENLMTSNLYDLRTIFTNPRFTGKFAVTFCANETVQAMRFYTATIAQPRAQLGLGI